MRTNIKTTTIKEKPIYILGTNAISLYLAAKFQLGGERVILLTDKRDEGNIANTEFHIKEDSAGKKEGIWIETSFWTKEEAKLVIIASGTQEVNSDIFRLGKEKLSHCPTLCLSLCEDINFIRMSLNTNIIQTWFDGWVNRKNNHLYAYGKLPKIMLNNPTDDETLRELEKRISPSGLKLRNPSLNEYKEKLYVRMGCSLACAICQKNLNQIFKNKSDTELLEHFFQEISSISEVEQTPISAERLMEIAKGIPANYIFPLQKSLSERHSGEYSYFNDYILRYTRRNDCKVDAMAQSLKKIYHTYLSIK